MSDFHSLTYLRELEARVAKLEAAASAPPLAVPIAEEAPRRTPLPGTTCPACEVPWQNHPSTAETCERLHEAMKGTAYEATKRQEALHERDYHKGRAEDAVRCYEGTCADLARVTEERDRLKLELASERARADYATRAPHGRCGSCGLPLPQPAAAVHQCYGGAVIATWPKP